MGQDEGPGAETGRSGGTSVSGRDVDVGVGVACGGYGGEGEDAAVVVGTFAAGGKGATRDVASGDDGMGGGGCAGAVLEVEAAAGGDAEAEARGEREPCPMVSSPPAGPSALLPTHRLLPVLWLIECFSLLRLLLLLVLLVLLLLLLEGAEADEARTCLLPGVISQAGKAGSSILHFQAVRR